MKDDYLVLNLSMMAKWKMPMRMWLSLSLTNSAVELMTHSLKNLLLMYNYNVEALDIAKRKKGEEHD